MKKKNTIVNLFLFLLGVILGIFFFSLVSLEMEESKENEASLIEHEEAVIGAVEKALPSVVSIVLQKEVGYGMRDHFEYFRHYEDIPEEEFGVGTGFFVSTDGIIITNKHVVIGEDFEYIVITGEGERLKAEVLALDPMQDIAFLKVEGEGYPKANLGDSSEIRVGQTAIAIGYALAELQNTVSVGVISGTGRRVEATDGRMVEILDDVIQTDAGINRGNSGGPLLNLNGEVIGINTAKGVRAQNIGFAIPINKAERAIRGAIEEGRIVYPFLGVRYILVDSNIKEARDLPVDYGALIVGGDYPYFAIEPGSGAEEAGLLEGDIILEFEGEKITTENSLAKIIVCYEPGDKVNLKIMRDGEKEVIEATLGER